MIQDIAPLKLDNHYENIPSDAESRVFCFGGQEFFGNRDEDGSIVLPRVSDFEIINASEDLTYLFSIGAEKFYLHKEGMKCNLTGFDKVNARAMRGQAAKKDCFAAATAYQLFSWYRDSKFCGRCGHEMNHLEKERGLSCPNCNLVVYPKIYPAVIVGVIDGERILVTKYAGRAYTSYALIAGFTEIGETAEETVEREVMEEVGLNVKNIRYYKSQPWGTDCDLLLGFFCDLDGDDTISLDKNELSVGEWIKREDFQPEDDGISLTREMMRVFKEGDL